MTRPPTERLLALLDMFPSQEVVIFGDLVLDEFQIGRIDRVSREAPVLILEHQRTEQVPGGGANAVANVAALGGIARPLGAVGQDRSGEALQELFRQRGIDTSGLRTVPGFLTPTKSRILGGSSTSVRQQIVRMDRGIRGSIPAEDRAALRAALAQRAPEAAAVLISDYDHGALDEGSRPGFSEAAAGCSVFTVDSRHHLARFTGMTAAAPNLEEAEEALDRRVPDEDATAGSAAGELRERLGAQHLIVTRGSHGMTLADDAGVVAHLPVFGSDEVADVTGAGDTVMAALTLALAAGASIVEATWLANVAAGLVVMKRGTATVTPEEIRTALREADVA